MRTIMTFNPKTPIQIYSNMVHVLHVLDKSEPKVYGWILIFLNKDIDK